MIDDDDAAGSHEPRALRRVQTDRARTEHDDGVSFDDVTELCAEVPRRQCIGAQQRVFVFHPVGDHRRTDVGERHPHELGLGAIVTTASVRVAVDSAHRGGIGIHVVAVGVEAPGTEVAGSAVDVERHHHPVAWFDVLHGRTDRFHHPDELVSEGVADPGIRHQTVIEVQVRSADGRQLHPHDRIIGMLDGRNVLVFNADFVWTAVRHRLHNSSCSNRWPRAAYPWHFGKNSARFQRSLASRTTCVISRSLRPARLPAQCVGACPCVTRTAWTAMYGLRRRSDNARGDGEGVRLRLGLPPKLRAGAVFLVFPSVPHVVSPSAPATRIASTVLTATSRHLSLFSTTSPVTTLL